MLSRGHLVGSYKRCAKSIRSIKEKGNENSERLAKCEKLMQEASAKYTNYNEILQSSKANIMNSENIRKCTESFYTLEYKISQKYANFCEQDNKTNFIKDKLKKCKSINNPLISGAVRATTSYSSDLFSAIKEKVTFARAGMAAAVTSVASENQSNKSTGTDVSAAETASSVKSDVPLDNIGVTDAIPEPPPIPDPSIEILNNLNALGEPTFASLGLGGWSPVGLVQNCFEYLHITLGIPWWEAIVIGTCIIRFLMFPLVIISQRNAARMNNYLPQMQAIQLKMTEARHSGNQLEAARLSQELMLFMREKKLNPLKNMIVPLAQMPVFVSFFIGLRQMANLPVDSLRTGGLYWFEDLTVPDQFFAMPIITSVTLWATIEMGVDGAKLNNQMHFMKYALRALPVVILPFTINFPGAILCYWVGSNFISLAQVGFLKIPAVRDYFKIDRIISHKPEHLPIKPKGFTEGLKDSWTNIKITRQLEERERLNELQFQRAGRGPVVKTYKHDPTRGNPNAISAKKR